MSKYADIQRLHRIIAQRGTSLNNLKTVTEPKGKVRKTYINARNELNTTMNSDLTPLLRAIVSRKPSFVEYFIKHGANVNARTDHGWTPLMVACQIRSTGGANPKDDIEMVRMLLKAGAHVNAKNEDGRNVILMCVRETSAFVREYHKTEYHTVLKMLLDAGANPREKDTNGISAVSQAEYQKDEAVLRMFGAGASPSTRTSPPRTPPKAGFTKTPYTNVHSGLSIYKKNATGRYYVRLRVPERGRTDGTITLDRKVRNASGTVKTLKEWLKGAPSASAGPSANNGYTRTQYKSSTGNPIFKKGRFYYYKSGDKYIRFTQDRNAVNSTGRKQTLEDWLKGKKPTSPPPPRSAPPPNHNTWTRMGYQKTVYELVDGRRIYKKSNRYWYAGDNGTIYQVGPTHRVKDTRTGEIGRFDFIKAKSNARKSSAASARPAASGVVNYEALYKRNLTRSNLAKIRRYAKNWLGKNIPANASYKRIALVIHPNKGNRTNATNQAKRTALFKYLSQMK